MFWQGDKSAYSLWRLQNVLNRAVVVTTDELLSLAFAYSLIIRVDES